MMRVQAPPQLLPKHVMMDKLFAISGPSPSTRIGGYSSWMWNNNAFEGALGN